MNTHTVSTHPEQGADIYAAVPGEQLGVRCLAQGHLVVVLLYIYIYIYIHTHSAIQKFGISKIFFVVLKKISFFCSSRLHLFDKIVREILLQFKIAVSILIYFQI